MIALCSVCGLSAQSSDWILQWEAFDRQAQQAEQVAQVIAVAEGAGPTWERGRALIALATHRPERAARLLTAFSTSKEVLLRVAAAEAAAELKGGDARAILGNLLSDPEPTVASAAALGLARHEGESAWRYVRDQVATYDPERSLLQARILATVGSEAAAARWDQFVEQAGDERHNLIRGLAWARGARWRIRMQDALVDGRIHRAAHAAILALPAEEYASFIDECLAAASDRYHQRVTELLFERPAAVGQKHLLRLLQAGELNRDALKLALDILRADLEADHAGIASRYLGDDDRNVRRRAVRLAAGIQDDQALFRVVRPALADQHVEVVREAVSVIAQTTEAVPEGGILDYVQAALDHDNRDVVREALKLISWRLDETETDRAIAVLRPFLSHEHKDVREDARTALTKAGGWRVAQTLGYVARWQLIGPFENDYDNGGFTRVHPPERTVDLTASYPVGERHAGARIQSLQWQQVEAGASGHLLLHNQLPPPVEYNVAYAYAEFSVRKATTATLKVEGDDAVAVWLNDGQVLSIGGDRKSSEEQRKKSRQDLRKWYDDKRKDHGNWWPPSADSVTVQLKAGRNRLLVKSANLDIYWWFRLRLLDADDKPMEVDW